MKRRTGRRLSVALIGSALALLAAAPAVAGPPATTASDASITVGRLVLEPTERGYRGSLPITVTNEGDTTTYFTVRITEPVRGTIADLVPSNACTYGYTADLRRIFDCGVPGPNLVPGEQRSFQMTFQVLTTPRSYPMVAEGGLVTVTPSGQPVADQSSFTTLFRSTSGSLRKPRPYVQDTRADAGLTTPGQVTLTRQADGSFLGRMPVTVRYGGDAGHDRLMIEAVTLPAGMRFQGTDPQDMPSFPTWVEVPGGQFMPGEVRSFDILFDVPAGTPLGPIGTATVLLSTHWAYGAVADVDPADNTVSFTVTTVEAS
ncbi:hypothetical protein [Micromonospora echinofusca]|uniref:Uncharacterized protein n=1 Tax=Micromonospora echinofusca TaxID=47858 RepID=A0ABS3VYZ4_MICEH|nr:hypothetical protein [Micromonospora echinofusca]MBO4209747.1 hypothetical protein [Micromonospora echinofusca]